ncbi:hypothetical protein HII28_18000 [Planctomonas sp. JC2975]|uniref:hypothetical protein n=1 Tax=Planctomonas sp. JC2975 TaxID=2729626 RepID=UPI001472CFA5|nr:hypothetical protein [Planctomonas sp. JC2975]NNC13761.1 hypothetical protein [Planctomonas sp. JC2975]
MKAELVNLVSKGKRETVVLLSTDAEDLTLPERVRVMELTVWLVDEGWTVMTTAESPLADLVRRGAEAMAGTYRTMEDLSGVQVVPAPQQLPPRIQ